MVIAGRLKDLREQKRSRKVTSKSAQVRFKNWASSTTTAARTSMVPSQAAFSTNKILLLDVAFPNFKATGN